MISNLICYTPNIIFRNFLSPHLPFLLLFPNTFSRYKDMDKDAGMTILDIGLLTAYTADAEDLNKVSHF